MAMPRFEGGPLGGMLGYSQEAGDPPPDVLAQMAMQGGPQGQGGPPGAPAEPSADTSAGMNFETLLAAAKKLSALEQHNLALGVFRNLAASDGELTEADKLLLEKITTLGQQFNANAEKDVQAAIGGRMSPAVGKAYAGAGG